MARSKKKLTKKQKRIAESFRQREEKGGPIQASPSDQAYAPRRKNVEKPIVERVLQPGEPLYQGGLRHIERMNREMGDLFSQGYRSVQNVVDETGEPIFTVFSK